jgi:3-deoxy-D-manno-octulosonate 8-phosphate phosphatase (KDO 8-P phosphatase)
LKTQRKKKLTLNELRKRARRLKLVLTDSDGVLTDAGVYYSENGEAFKRFSIRDGMGVERLRIAGIESAIITGEKSESVRRRAEKLQMPRVYLGVKDKRQMLESILEETGLTVAQIGYIGDDVNDLGILDAVANGGLTAAPSDAMPVVLEMVHYRCGLPGGHGAFRDFAEWILRRRA